MDEVHDSNDVQCTITDALDSAVVIDTAPPFVASLVQEVNVVFASLVPSIVSVHPLPSDATITDAACVESTVRCVNVQLVISALPLPSTTIAACDHFDECDALSIIT